MTPSLQPLRQFLRLRAGTQTFALPLESVIRVEAASPGAAAGSDVDLIERLQLDADPPRRVIVEVAAAGRLVRLAAGSAGSTAAAPTIPVPALSGCYGTPPPFSHVALFDDGLALVLDPGGVAGLPPPSARAAARRAFTSLRQGNGNDGTAPERSPDTPVLLCSLGPYRLNGRSFLLGVPLASAVMVETAHCIVPLPLVEPPVAGLAVFDHEAVPVYCPVRALGLPDTSTVRRHLVVVRSSRGRVALHVAAAQGTLQPRHWAPAPSLAPVRSPAIAGALHRRDGWVAVIDPDRLGDAA